MIKDLAIITNTHSKNSDLWVAHVKQIKKYLNQPHYFFTNTIPEADLGVKAITYSTDDKFRTQFLKCLGSVKEDYCLYLNEDYLLYEAPDINKLEEYVDVLKSNESLSFIRLAKGIDRFNIPFSSTLQYLDCRNPYFFSQTASLWRTNHLRAIHEHGPDLHIAGHNMDQQFETAASDTCRELGIQGLYHYAGEPKRGMYHHDTKVFPYICSALVKGDWCSEYEKELKTLLQMYGVDESSRRWSP
tara:strand:- start:5268 stop:5999 length:732 start_codon:yes stop_codon:yes gene_type:complete